MRIKKKMKIMFIYLRQRSIKIKKKLPPFFGSKSPKNGIGLFKKQFEIIYGMAIKI